MKIFSGSANRPLARNIAKKTANELVEVETSRFANGEVRVFVKNKFKESEAVVVQSLSRPPDEHLVEFCFICDAVRRMGASKITGVIPWLGYSKQDKVFREGEPLSVKIIAKMIQVVPLEKIITLDLHNPAILGFFDVSVANLTAKPLFLDYFKKTTDSGLMVVAPDAGSVKSSTDFAKKIGAQVAYIDKERDLKTGKVKVVGISRKVAGYNVLMVDDMIATGSTLIETSKFLNNKGVKSIRVAATHHLYLPGVAEKLEASAIDEIVVTDSIEIPEDFNSNKTKILSCADVIVSEL